MTLKASNALTVTCWAALAYWVLAAAAAVKDFYFPSPDSKKSFLVVFILLGAFCGPVFYGLMAMVAFGRPRKPEQPESRRVSWKRIGLRIFALLPLIPILASVVWTGEMALRD